MIEQPRIAAHISRSTAAPSQFHGIAIEDVGDQIAAHLHYALRTGTPLVVTVGGEPQITLETVEDLEVLHEAVVAREATAGGPPGGSAGPVERT